jgi:hypothetical protein
MGCVALGISYEKVYPKVWQKEMFLEIPPIRKKNGSTDTKAMAYVAAKKYFPNIKLTKKDDGLTDALLLAEYGRRIFK